MRRSISVLAAVLAVVVGAAAAASAAGPLWDSPEQRSDILTLRQATAAYHDVANAVADGYMTDGHCVPGMGVHYVKFTLVDDVIDPAEPEALVYEPTDDGLELRAAEHIFVTDSPGRPSAYGGVTFDDFFLPPVSYALHVWVWGKANPDGTFNATNPEVICPAD